MTQLICKNGSMSANGAKRTMKLPDRMSLIHPWPMGTKPDGGDDLVWVLGPAEGARVVIGLGEEALDGGLKVDKGMEHAALQRPVRPVRLAARKRDTGTLPRWTTRWRTSPADAHGVGGAEYQYVSERTSQFAVIYTFRRSRFTFARVRLTKGASTAAWLRPLASASIDVCMAATFSAAMRRYSAAAHVPRTIIRVRRMIVSHDAIVSRAIIIGRA